MQTPNKRPVFTLFGLTDYGHQDGEIFCLDPACPCHEDELMIYQVYLYVQDGLMTPEEATAFVEGKGI